MRRETGRWREGWGGASSELHRALTGSCRENEKKKKGSAHGDAREGIIWMATWQVPCG